MKRTIVLGVCLLLGCSNRPEPGQQKAAGRLDKKPNKPDVGALVNQLKDPQYQVRRKAAKTLGEIATEADVAVPPLSEMVLDDEDSITREVAAEALRHFGPKAAPVVPKLLKAVKEETGYRRDTVISCLGKLGLEAETVVPVLVAASGEQQPTKNYALRALGNFGPGAKAALPELREAMTDLSPPVRLVGARAVWKVSQQSKDVLPVLVAVLKDTSRPPGSVGGIERLDEGMLLRREAAQALGEMGPDATEAVLALIVATEDRAPEVRVEAALALWKVDRQAERPVTTLTKVLELKDSSASQFPLSGAQAVAAEYLGEIGPPARAAVPVLQQIRADPLRVDQVKEAAAKAKERINAR